MDQVSEFEYLSEKYQLQRKVKTQDRKMAEKIPGMRPLFSQTAD
jgi:hypothetical protein